MPPCKYCGHNFSAQKNLNRHLRDKHNATERNIQSYEFSEFDSKCSDCKVSFKFVADLREHLEVVHSKLQEFDQLTFKDETGRSIINF